MTSREGRAAGTLREVARLRLKGRPPLASEHLARDVLALRDVDRALAERLLGTLLEGDRGFERVEAGWRLAPRGAVDRPLAEAPFVVVDVETTGGRPTDRILEIGAVQARAGRLEAEWSALVNPGRPIPSFVQRLTGIHAAAIARAPGFASVADDFLDFLGPAPFVAHNAGFDWRAINAELARTLGRTLENERFCTLILSRRLVPGMRRRNLSTLARSFDIPVTIRHRALPDARAAARILVRLLDLAAERGARTVADLSALCERAGTLGRPRS